MFIDVNDAETILDAIDFLDENGEATIRHYELVADIADVYPEVGYDFDTLIGRSNGISLANRAAKGY
jgi:hypothetical protein